MSYVDPIAQPIRFSHRARFLLSTAIVSLGVTIAVSAAPARAEQFLLNNGPDDGQLDQAPVGVWSDSSVIWSLLDGSEADGDRQAIGGDGEQNHTAILPAHTLTPSQTAELQVDGTVSVEGITVNGSGYTLGSVDEDAELRGSGSGRSLTFTVNDGNSLAIDALRLNGRVIVSGTGQVVYGGDAGAGMLGLAVGSLATFISTGTTHGPVTGDGVITLADNQGAVTTGGTLTTTGTITGALRNTGTGTANLSGTITDHVFNDGSVMTVTGPLTVRSLRNAAGSVLNINETTDADPDLTLIARPPGQPGFLFNRGTVNLAGDVSGHISNGVQPETPAQPIVLNLNGGSISGNLASYRGSEVNGWGEIGGNLDNRGVLNVTGDGGAGRTLSAATMTNAATGNVTVTADQTLSVRNRVDNRGRLTVDGNLAGASGDRLLNSGVVTVNSTGTVTGNVDNRATLNSTGRIAGNLLNGGVGVATMSGTVTGTVTNQNQGRFLTGGTLETGGFLNTDRGFVGIGNGHILRVGGGSGTFVNSNVNAQNEAQGLEVGGTLDASLTNAGRAVLGAADPATPATVTGSVTNDGLVVLRGHTSIGGALTNNDTIRSVGGDPVNLSVAGAFRNVAGAQILGTDGEIVLSAAGGLFFEEGGVVEGVTLDGNIGNEGTLHLSSDQNRTGSLVNAATGHVRVSANIDAGGFQTVNNGRFTVHRNGNYHSVSVFENNRTLTIESQGGQRGRLGATRLDNGAGGTVNNSGDVTARVVNAGTVTNSGLIRGGVQNENVLVSTGRVEGTVLNRGTASLSGTINGHVQNGATLTTTGDLTVDTFSNSGNAAFGTGRNQTVTVGSPVSNIGTATVVGTLVGGVNNLSRGSRLDMAGGQVSGDVSNLGTVAGSGTIRGTLGNTGQGVINIAQGHELDVDVVQNAATARVAGTLVSGDIRNLAGGSFTLAGGTVRGGINNRGNLSGNGTIHGGVTNAGAGTLGLEGVVTGRLTQNSSRALNHTGDLTVAVLDNRTETNIAAGSSLVATGGGWNLDNHNRLQLAGSLNGNLFNREGALTVLSNSGRIAGDVRNDGTLRGFGTVTGNLTNRTTGILRTGGTVGGLLLNEGRFEPVRTTTVGGLDNRSTIIMGADTVLDATNGTTNSGTIDINGGARLRGAVTNNAGGLIDIAQNGRIVGDLTNRGELTSAGWIAGNLSNMANADATLTGRVDGEVNNHGDLTSTGRIVGGVINRATGDATLSGTVEGVVTNHGEVETGGDLRVRGLTNTDIATIRAGTVLYTQTRINNTATLNNFGRIVLTGPGNRQSVVNSGAVSLAASTAAGSPLAAPAAGGIENGVGGILTGGGTFEANILNEGLMTTTGEITGFVDNSGNGRAEISGIIGDDLINRENASLLTTGALTVNRLVNSSQARVTANTRLTSLNRAENSGSLTVGGEFSGDLLNDNGGRLNLVGSGLISGDVVNRGGITGSGTIAGHLQNDTALTIGNGGQRLSVREGVTNTSELTLIGNGLAGDLHNTADGRLTARNATVDGALQNDGEVDLRGGGGDLRVGGLSGSGTYRLDVDLLNMTADRIIVSGGAATGYYDFDFGDLPIRTVNEVGREVTILEVDQSFGSGNSYRYDPQVLDTASERIVYSLNRQSTGDLTIVSQINPAIGAILGNIALTHSLIGSVINRPTSPYVIGMAYEGTGKSCGLGSWGRALGGHAEATGATDNGTSTVESTVTADYYGMQVGTDLACFNGHFGGWNMAFGTLLGVNRGDTRQPIYGISGTDSTSLTDRLTSVTRTDFDQIYGGLYLTASRDAWTFDVQYRYEKTDFEITNEAIAGRGLGLADPDLTSKAHTISGAVSYALPVGGSGWQVVPTAGFAWSKYDIDDLRFEDGYRMSFGETQRKVGFVGGTLTKTFVQVADNSAVNVFATGTYYKDFAEKTDSTFTQDGNPDFRQRLLSDHLGAYTEVSLGANYVKVLTGGPSRPRQLSAGTRIDARFGDNIDSVGVTGQFRLQF